MTICFFVGNATASNVTLTVANMGKMLDGFSNLHLVTTNPSAYEDITTFETFGGTHSSRYGEFRALQSYLQKMNPSVIVQVTEPPIHGSITGFLGRHHDVPVVYRYAGDRFRTFRLHEGTKQLALYGLNNVLGRVPLQLADRFIALGSSGRGRLVAYGVSPSRVYVLPPPIDHSRFSVEETVKLDVPDERQIALFIGRVSRLKGVETIERTIDRVLDRRPDLQFVFVGEIEHQTSALSKYSDHLTFVGRVSLERIPAYLETADVLVHPSLTEGFPRSVLESLFSSTPVIARDVGEVASVTDNTFRTDQEFVEMLCEFEQLPVDDPPPFSVDSLETKYTDFFSHYVE